MLYSQRPQLLHGVYAFRHQDSDHPGGVGYGAAANAHQGVHALGHSQVGRLHCRSQWSALGEAGVNAGREFPQGFVDLADRVGLLGYGAPGQHQHPFAAKVFDLLSQRRCLTLTKYNPAGHRGVEFARKNAMTHHAGTLQATDSLIRQRNDDEEARLVAHHPGEMARPGQVFRQQHRSRAAMFHSSVRCP